MLISVVTVVRNSARTIQHCLASVQQQPVSPEHIVVDGQSTDGTLEILHQAQAGNPRLDMISEADTGIYDAMGKGLARARGEVIGCLNADDFYATSTVLERVSEVFADPAIDSCYGDLVFVDHPGEKVVRRWHAGRMSSRAFYWGWMPPHPTFFVRRSVYERYGGFRLDLGTAADYELMLRFLVKHRITTCYIPAVLVKMRVGGVSNASLRNRLLAHQYDRKAWTVNGLRPYPWTLLLKPVRKLGQWLA